MMVLAQVIGARAGNRTLNLGIKSLPTVRLSEDQGGSARLIRTRIYDATVSESLLECQGVSRSRCQIRCGVSGASWDDFGSSLTRVWRSDGDRKILVDPVAAGQLGTTPGTPVLTRLRRAGQESVEFFAGLVVTGVREPLQLEQISFGHRAGG
jgi:hypothetical protein